MEIIEEIFQKSPNKFTVFVFSNSFSNSFAKSYLENYINTEHFLDSNEKIIKNINKAFNIIEKSITSIKVLVEFIADVSQKSLLAVLTAPQTFANIIKLFTAQEHKAVRLDNVSPIIISSKDIDKRFIDKLVNIFQDSILKPTIIIADNKDEFIEEEYANFPDGTVIRYIKTSRCISDYTVINNGAKNVEDFIVAFSDRCFNTCANTENKLLFNEDYQNNNIISKYTKPILKIHTNLLHDRKDNVKDDINKYIGELSSIKYDSNYDYEIAQLYLCVLLICRVFCNDSGKNDMKNALFISNELGNEVLKAHVYRYADFLSISKPEKIELLDKAGAIFTNNSMPDHAVYSENNKLVEQFFTDNVNTDEFINNAILAQERVPGMCGMSHILNNVGVAFLYNGKYEDAIEYFDRGLTYSQPQSRIVQNYALLSNRMIARSCLLETIPENDLQLLSNKIKDAMENRLTFISARYQMNLVSIAFKQNPAFGKELLMKNDIINNINNCINNHQTGAGQLNLQIQYLSQYSDFPTDLFCTSKTNYSVGGKREIFITQKGVNPFHFKTWL